MTDLQAALSSAYRANEQKLSSSARIAAKPFEPDAHEQRGLQLYAQWCRDRGVKALPASPIVLAAYVRFEAEAGISGEQIARFLAAVIRWHDAHLLANAVMSQPVKEQLQALFGESREVEELAFEPRSWSAAERVIYAGLAPEVQQIIKRHAALDSAAVRRAQDKAATELRKRISELEQKGSTNGTT
jgi:hypothetical protein